MMSNNSPQDRGEPHSWDLRMPTIADRIGSTAISNTVISDTIRNNAVNITHLIQAVQKQDHNLAMRIATDVKSFFDQIAEQFMIRVFGQAGVADVKPHGFQPFGEQLGTLAVLGHSQRQVRDA